MTDGTSAAIIGVVGLAFLSLWLAIGINSGFVF